MHRVDARRMVTAQVPRPFAWAIARCNRNSRTAGIATHPEGGSIIEHARRIGNDTPPKTAEYDRPADWKEPDGSRRDQEDQLPGGNAKMLENRRSSELSGDVRAVRD